MTNWHDDDTFWTFMAPFMFDESRWIGTAAEIDRVLDLVPLAPGAAVLDLGCGPGRHTLELARRGFRMTGVDRTAFFLEQARQKAADEELDVEFLLADMRQFRRPERFDAVLSLFTTFGYFEAAAENQQVLQNVYDSLRPGGVVLLELMGKEALARVFKERDWDEHEGTFWLQERTIERNWSWIQNRWILLAEGKRSEFELGHWLYSAVELRWMLEEAGFSRVTAYGDLEGRPYDHTARRLVVAAWKV